MMTRKAFTLLELLIVLTIIIVLTGLLVPVLGRAREGARRAMCANNLRQIGIAWQVYLTDNDDRFPNTSRFYFGGSGDSSPPSAEDRPLNPYLDVFSDEDKGALQVFYCPSDRPGATPGCSDYKESYFNNYGNSYEMNINLQNQSVFSVEVPYSKLMLSMDSVFWDRSVHGGSGLYKKVNILFLDGHIKMHDWVYDVHNPPHRRDPSKPVYLKLTAW